MNRGDRPVALVMMLQSRRVTTAAEMASHFEVTERTVYQRVHRQAWITTIQTTQNTMSQSNEPTVSISLTCKRAAMV